MPVSLKNVVPWGRSMEEYRRMFSLTEADMLKSIVGCGDGPASCNAEMTALGRSVVSFDPIYRFSSEEIEMRFEESVEQVMSQVRATPESWTWGYHKDADDLLHNRRTALERFLNDYEQGKAEGRYVTGEMPMLDFTDGQFDLALCSHFLFLYSEHFSYEFHMSSILEMCRIAKEVRIFPILNLKQERSPYLDQVIEELHSRGMDAEVRKVDYELQKGGNQALFVSRKEMKE